MAPRVLTQRNPESVWLTENSDFSKVGSRGKRTEVFLKGDIKNLLSIRHMHKLNMQLE